jgi:hypothetical protein
MMMSEPRYLDAVAIFLLRRGTRAGPFRGFIRGLKIISPNNMIENGGFFGVKNVKGVATPGNL